MATPLSLIVNSNINLPKVDKLPSSQLAQRLPAPPEHEVKSLASRKIKDENIPSEPWVSIKKTFKHHWKKTFRPRLVEKDYSMRKQLLIDWVKHLASQEAAIKLVQLLTAKKASEEDLFKIKQIRIELIDKDWLGNLLNDAIKQNDIEFLSKLNELSVLAPMLSIPIPHDYAIVFPLSQACKERKQDIVMLFLRTIAESQNPEKALICQRSTIFLSLLENEQEQKGMDSTLLNLIDFLSKEQLVKILMHTEQPKDIQFMPCYSVIVLLMKYGNLNVLEALQKKIPKEFNRIIQVRDYVRLGGVHQKQHALGDQCCAFIIKCGGFVGNYFKVYSALDKYKYPIALSELEKRPEFLNYFKVDVSNADQLQFHIDDFLKCDFANPSLVEHFFEGLLQLIAKRPNLINKNMVAKLSLYVANLNAKGFVYPQQGQTLTILQRFVNKLNEELKINDEIALEIINIFALLNIRHPNIWTVVVDLPQRFRINFIKLLIANKVNPNAEVTHSVLRKLVWIRDFATLQFIINYPELKNSFSLLVIKAFYFSPEPEKAVAELLEALKREDFVKEFEPTLFNAWCVLLGDLNEEQMKLAMHFIESAMPYCPASNNFEDLLCVLSDYQVTIPDKYLMSLAWAFLRQHKNVKDVVDNIFINKSVLFGIRRLLSVILNNHKKETKFSEMVIVLESIIANKNCIMVLDNVTEVNQLEEIYFAYALLFEYDLKIPYIKGLNCGFVLNFVLLKVLTELNKYLIEVGLKIAPSDRDVLIKVSHELRLMVFYSPAFKKHQSQSRNAARIRNHILNMPLVTSARAPKEFLLYSGVPTHAVVQVISRVEENYFNLTTCNTGIGSIQDETDPEMVWVDSYIDVTKEDFSHRFLFKMSLLQIEGKDYEEMNKLLDAELNPDAYIDHITTIPAQKLKTCALMSLMRLLESGLGDQFQPFFLYWLNQIHSELENIINSEMEFAVYLAFGTTKREDAIQELRSWQREIEGVLKSAEESE